MRRPKLLDCVALKKDLPEFRLRAGDTGVVVEVYARDAVEVEFMDSEGDTVALLTLNDVDLRSLSEKDAAHGQHAASLPPGAEEYIADATQAVSEERFPRV